MATAFQEKMAFENEHAAYRVKLAAAQTGRSSPLPYITQFLVPSGRLGLAGLGDLPQQYMALADATATLRRQSADGWIGRHWFSGGARSSSYGLCAKAQQAYRGGASGDPQSQTRGEQCDNSVSGI